MASTTANSLPSFSTLVSDIDRFNLPLLRNPSCYLPSLSSLNLLPTLINTTSSTTIIQHPNQPYFFSHKRKIEFIDTVSIHPMPQNSVQQYPTSPKPSSPTQTDCSSWKKETKKVKLEKEHNSTKLISVGSLQKVIYEVLEQYGKESAAGDCQEEEDKDADVLGPLFVKLRTRVYVEMLQYSETSKQHGAGEKRFICPFYCTCKKTLKGLGNLRRHIEWHLTRLEEDVRYQSKYISEKITPQKACSLVLQEIERQKKSEEC